MDLAGKDLQVKDVHKDLDAKKKTITHRNGIRIAQLWLAGYNRKEIARVLNVTSNTVNRWLQRDDVTEVINEYQRYEEELVKQHARALREKALNTMSELMDCEDDRVRYNASKDILDRTGIKEADKKEVNINTTITYEQQLSNLLEGIECEVMEVENV